MYIEMVWNKTLVAEEYVRDKLINDFVSFEVKPFDMGRVLICGDNKLVFHGGIEWMSFEPKKDEDIIYFEKGSDLHWLVTPVVNEMYKRMRNGGERAFAGSDINQLISYLLKCLSEIKWKPKIKEEDKKTE